MQNSPATPDELARIRNLVLTIALVLALSPTSYALLFGGTLGAFQPDSTAYLTLANQLFSEGRLYLSGWGHVDTGLILPPLYPAAVALAGLVHPDPMSNAVMISGISLLASEILVYLCIRKLAGWWSGVLGALTVAYNYQSVFYGGTPLSDPLFVCFTVATLYAFLSFRDEASGLAESAILAALAAMSFFARQLGVAVFFVCLLGILWPALTTPGRRREVTGHALRFSAVYISILMAYAIPLYVQTGHTPATQYFRLGHYTVYQDAGRNEALKSPSDDSYSAIYAQRREDARLGAAGTEMIAYELPSSAAPKSAVPAAILAWPGHLFENLLLEVSTFGWPFALAGALSLLVGLFLLPTRRALPLFLFPLAYLGILSLFSGNIIRYLLPLVPVSAILTFSVIPRAFVRCGKHSGLLAAGFSAFLCVLFSVTASQTLADVHISERTAEQDIRAVRCMNSVPAGSPIYTLVPMEAYALRGTPRTIPNDSLERVLDYAKLTNVHWMSFRDDTLNAQMASFYRHADWLQNKLSLHHFDRRLVPVCYSPATNFYVYRIEDVAPEKDAPRAAPALLSRH